MPGKLVHFELPSQNATRARDFWSGLFGWEFQDSGMPGIDYFMVRTGDDQGGAVYPSDGSIRGPIVYFDTDDIDASLGKVRELGGDADEKQPIPGVGWFARCKDSEGNEFSLYQSDESVPHQ
jgi:predicted enzyme related to lactoylglutathione lyase